MRALWLGLLLITSCGTNNLAAPYTEDTPDEKAKKALDAGDYDTAIATYEDLVAQDPEGYQRFPLLAAAYAGKAGVDIVNIVKQQFESSSSAGSVFEMLGDFVPQTPTDDELTAIQDSVRILEAIPADHRVDGAFDYSSGAAFQLSLYLVASSAMLLNQFMNEAGQFTPESLADMTEEDVEMILANLDAIAASQGGGASQEALQGKSASTLAAIQAQPGDTLKEKMSSYLSQ